MNFFLLLLALEIFSVRPIKEKMVFIDFRAEIVSIKNDTINLRTIVTNKSSDVLQFTKMSCEWGPIYYSDNPNIEIIKPIQCPKNIPLTITLRPNQKDTFLFDAEILKSFDTLNPRLKIAFNWVIPREYESRQKTIFETQNLFWSNLLIVDKRHY